MKAVFCALVLCALLAVGSSAVSVKSNPRHKKLAAEPASGPLGRKWPFPPSEQTECYGPAMKLADEFIGMANVHDLNGFKYLLSDDFVAIFPQMEPASYREMNKEQFLNFLNATWQAQGLTANFPMLRLCSGRFAALVVESSGFQTDGAAGKYKGYNMPIVMFIDTNMEHTKVSRFLEIWDDAGHNQANFTQSVGVWDKLAQGSVDGNITVFEEVLSKDLFGMTLPCGDYPSIEVNRTYILDAEKDQFKYQVKNQVFKKKQWVGGLWVATHYIEMTQLEGGIQQIVEDITLVQLVKDTYQVDKYFEFGKIWLAKH